MKKITIKKTSMKGYEHTYTGTIPELAEKFSYTLENGHSWNSKINRNPKTAKSLVSNLNAAAREFQRGYNHDYYELMA